MMPYETIHTAINEAVGIITLNRPAVLNALNRQLIEELLNALENFQQNTAIGAVILRGSTKAFAAGADIQEMKDLTFATAYSENFLSRWDEVTNFRKPLIAAVAGFCLGGGCELAMMCDIIIADTTAKFGQPELGLGIIPGAGGTQRLTRIIGRPKTMDLVLTGRMMPAEEAERAGLISRLVAPEQLEEVALSIAQKIASLSKPVVMMAKEAINRAEETSLSEGLRFERRMIQAAFALEDQKEGMAAFLEKRKGQFRHR